MKNISAASWSAVVVLLLGTFSVFSCNKTRIPEPSPSVITSVDRAGLSQELGTQVAANKHFRRTWALAHRLHVQLRRATHRKSSGQIAAYAKQLAEMASATPTAHTGQTVMTMLGFRNAASFVKWQSALDREFAALQADIPAFAKLSQSDQQQLITNLIESKRLIPLQQVNGWGKNTSSRTSLAQDDEENTETEPTVDEDEDENGDGESGDAEADDGESGDNDGSYDGNDDGEDDGNDDEGVNGEYDETSDEGSNADGSTPSPSPSPTQICILTRRLCVGTATSAYVGAIAGCSGAANTTLQRACYAAASSGLYFALRLCYLNKC